MRESATWGTQAGLSSGGGWSVIVAAAPHSIQEDTTMTPQIAARLLYYRQRVAAKEHAAMTGISLKIFDTAIWPEDEDIYEHPRAGVLTTAPAPDDEMGACGRCHCGSGLECPERVTNNPGPHCGAANRRDHLDVYWMPV